MALENLRVERDVAKSDKYAVDIEYLTILKRWARSLGIQNYIDLIEDEMATRTSVIKNARDWGSVSQDLKKVSEKEPTGDELYEYLPPSYQKSNPDGWKLLEEFKGKPVNEKYKILSDTNTWGLPEGTEISEPLFEAFKLLNAIVTKQEKREQGPKR